MTTAYRDDLIAARLERDALLERHREELASVPVDLGRIHARRVARTVAGKAAVGSVIVLGMVAIHILVASIMDPIRPNRLDGRLTVVLLSAWVVVAAAYAAGRLLGGLAFRREVARPLHLTEDVHADVERLRTGGPFRAVKDFVERGETASVAYPLMGLALLVPLTLHFGAYAVAVIAEGTRLERALEGFDEWIAASMILVGHAHLVLVYLARRYAQRLGALSNAQIDRSPPPGGMSALAYTTGSSMLAGAIGLLVSPISGLVGMLVIGALAGITGLLFVPWSFTSLRRRLVQERVTLEALTNA
jgi:hypothetical protein